LKTCLSLSFDTGDLSSSGVGWANAIMLRSKTVPSTPRVPTKGLGISSGSAANRFSRCGLAGLFESRCAQQGRRRRERLDHRSKERTRLARPYASPYTRSALPPIVPNGGAALNVAVGRVPSVFSRVLENGTNCGGRTKPSYLPANGASVVCPRREREEARSSRNDHPED
jgi:hypothetical protein